MSTIDSLIHQAQKILKNYPFDAAHDLIHHQAVWRTAKDIAEHLDRPVNLDALKLACFWHDVVLNDQVDRQGVKNVDHTADYFKKKMETEQFDPKFINEVYLAVKYHEYSRQPKNLTGFILYDADKLEVLSIKRINRMLQAGVDQEMSKEVLFQYAHTIAVWLKEMRNKFHFPYSRVEFDHRLKELNHEINTNITTATLAHQLNLDLTTLTKGVFQK